jgi:hypothetical protein
MTIERRLGESPGRADGCGTSLRTFSGWLASIRNHLPLEPSRWMSKRSPSRERTALALWPRAEELLSPFTAEVRSSHGSMLRPSGLTG